MKYEEYLATFNTLCIFYFLSENFYFQPRRVKKYQEDIAKGIIEQLEKSDSVIFVTPDKEVLSDKGGNV